MVSILQETTICEPIVWCDGEVATEIPSEVVGGKPTYHCEKCGTYYSIVFGEEDGASGEGITIMPNRVDKTPREEIDANNLKAVAQILAQFEEGIISQAQDALLLIGYVVKPYIIAVKRRKEK